MVDALTLANPQFTSFIATNDGFGGTDVALVSQTGHGVLTAGLGLPVKA